ncbi:hypothetical protein FOZ60_012459 [Perkinsus olseni]|uniref:Uncharacterized protein n=1 Tax=Perkinsus olseni TaxID=32597 RepID=A0A7J6NBG6_PEROL|nr:hypothetical protein FOZ60_012459 [Perkinsus olseni]
MESKSSARRAATVSVSLGSPPVRATDEIILSECIIKFMKNPPELARRLLVLVVLTILDITVTKAIPSSLPGWTPLVTEMSYLERKVKDECDMPWKIGFRVLLEPLFAYGGVALMVSCVLGRAFLMLFLTDGGGFLDSLALTTLPSVACNLAALTLFGKVPRYAGKGPVAHTSFVSALFGVLVRRISRVLLYRKPKKGFRPVGVVLQFFSLGVVLFSMSVVLAVITADMLLAVEPKIPSVPAKATFAAIIFGNEVTRLIVWRGVLPFAEKGGAAVLGEIVSSEKKTEEGEEKSREEDTDMSPIHAGFGESVAVVGRNLPVVDVLQTLYSAMSKDLRCRCENG